MKNVSSTCWNSLSGNKKKGEKRKQSKNYETNRTNIIVTLRETRKKERNTFLIRSFRIMPFNGRHYLYGE